MVMRQIRTSLETRAMMEKLKSIYLSEKFEADDMVTMTVGYILNTAYKEVEKTSDWNSIIDNTLTIEDKYLSSVKKSKTPITRFRLSEHTSEGIDTLTKNFANEIGLKVQIGFTVKQILKAAILLREENISMCEKELDFDDLPIEEKEAIWDSLFPNMTDEEIAEEIEGWE